jgi:hypothetical protein
MFSTMNAEAAALASRDSIDRYISYISDDDGVSKRSKNRTGISGAVWVNVWRN